MSLPLTDIDLVIWINKFAKAFASHAARLGFTPEDVASVANDAAMFEFLVCEEIPAYEKALSTRINYKNQIKVGTPEENSDASPSSQPATPRPMAVEPGIMPRIQVLIERILAMPAYENNLAEEFGLQGIESAKYFDLRTVKPMGRAYGQFDSEVHVEFQTSEFDGVLIESRRTGQDEWRRLAINDFSPYVDSRPLVRGGRPEVREYRLRFLMRDVPVGEWSDILVATTSA